MRRRAFDLAGVLSILAFAAVVVADLDELRLARGEMPLTVSAEERRLGFREGDLWYAFFLLEPADAKVGYSKVERRLVGDERQLRIASLLRPTVLGQTHEVELRLTAVLDPWMALVTLSMEAITGGAVLRAEARVAGSEIEITIKGGDFEHSTSLPLEQAITLDMGAWPMVLAGEPAVGQRFAVPTFDLATFQPATSTVTYLGREEIEVLDQQVNSHVFEQQVGRQPLRVWVNELGEVMREELPVGIIAERVSEADASWGFGAGGVEISSVMERLPALFPQLGSSMGLPVQPPRPSATPESLP